jgi:lysophospholipase L1-like esterase
MNKLGAFFQSTFLIIGITAFLFVLVNLAALWLLPAPVQNAFPKSDSILNHGIPPASKEGQEILTRYFSAAFAEQVAAACNAEGPTPSFAPHPILHYIVTPTRNRFYQMGVENIRYDEGWTDEQAKTLLKTAKRKIFLFGGSTMYGFGLASDQTIQHYLQKKFPGGDVAVFNFGANAYDQQREIDWLVYLLRHGYVPDDVVFFDGVNDATHMAASNYRVGDKLIYHGFLSGRSRSAEQDDFTVPSATPQKLTWKDYLRLQAHALPIIRPLIEQPVKPTSYDNATLPQELDPFQPRVDIHMAEYVFYHWGTQGDAYLDLRKREILEYYKRNQDFLARLAQGYGFKVHLFLQPMGALDPQNPFMPQIDEKVPGYRYYHAMYPFMREQIVSGQLHMTDLSEALLELSKSHRAYIDTMHYSPQANEILAQKIFERMESSKGKRP